jgi:hypothetical protein
MCSGCGWAEAEGVLQRAGGLTFVFISWRSWIGCGYGRLFHHVDEPARCFGESRNAKMACSLFAAAKIDDEIDTLAIRWPDPKISLLKSQFLTLTSIHALGSLPLLFSHGWEHWWPGLNNRCDDDYLRWQEEIRHAEEEVEALEAGKTHRCHKVAHRSHKEVPTSLRSSQFWRWHQHTPWGACPNSLAMAESIGGQASTTDVDDDYLRWQEEIWLA